MMRVRFDRHVAWFPAGDGTNAREYTTHPETLPRKRSAQFTTKPEVTGKGGIRFVVVRVVESVFFRKEIANHALPPQTGILPQWRQGTAHSDDEPEGRASMGGIRRVRLDRSQGAPSTNPIFIGSVSTQ